MKLKDIIEITNNPILVQNNVNLGKCTEIREMPLKTYLECEIERIEGVGTHKEVAVYLKGNKNGRNNR